jgi:undecaprenyl-diphosphatase
MVSLAILYPRFSLPFIFCATVVAASRVLIGAHFVSDVIMGSYMGLILTFYLYTQFIRNGWLPRFTVDD